MKATGDKLIFPQDNQRALRQIQKLEKEIAWLRKDKEKKQKERGRRIILAIKEKELYMLKYTLLMSIAQLLPGIEFKDTKAVDAPELSIRLSSKTTMN